MYPLSSIQVRPMQQTLFPSSIHIKPSWEVKQLLQVVRKIAKYMRMKFFHQNILREPYSTYLNPITLGEPMTAAGN